MSSVYDLIVIGSGPAGQRAAIYASKLGKKVALVEMREVVGGASINTGTIPSKTMREAVLHLSGYNYKSIYGMNYRVKEKFTMADLAFRVQHVIKTEIDVTEAQLSRNDIEMLVGIASFEEADHSKVTNSRGSSVYEAKNIIIGTGAAGLARLDADRPRPGHLDGHRLRVGRRRAAPPLFMRSRAWSGRSSWGCAAPWGRRLGIGVYALLCARFTSAGCTHRRIGASRVHARRRAAHLSAAPQRSRRLGRRAPRGYLAERLRLTGGALQAATARAHEAERLAVLGRIAAGLAHEIRNPLGSITGSIEMLRESPALSDEDRRLCDIVHREARRLNNLVGDMVDLRARSARGSRPPTLRRSPARSSLWPRTRRAAPTWR